jgi:hypothetical protein
LPDLPPDQPNGAYGWIVAAFVTVLAAVGTFWNVIRGGRREDSTTALTHANKIIAGWERYAARQDERVKGFERQVAELWAAVNDGRAKEERCRLRLEWVCEKLREHDIPIPNWPDDPHAGGDE